MIVLLGYSINCLANKSDNSSTGGLSEADSVKIAYDDLRLVNSKLVELDYTKDSNTKLKNIISNDSIIKEKFKTLTDKLSIKNTTYRRQRNICFIVAVATTVGLFVSLIK